MNKKNNNKQSTRHVQKDRHNDEYYILRLYIAGYTPRSVIAIKNLKQICKKYLNSSYQLEVINLYQEPQLAERDQVIVVPTLIKRMPEPLRSVIGDLSNTERVLAGLDLKAQDTN